MTKDHPFWRACRVNSELVDAFVALLGELTAAENGLDRVDDKHSIDYQRGKVAAYRRLAATAQQIATQRMKEKE